jgi:outer membrane protein
MKRSVSAICLLASGLGLSALAQTSAPMPSAPAPANAPAPAAAAPAGPSKVAVILFEAAVGQTNEGQRDIQQIQQKFLPKQTQLKTLSDEIDTLRKQLQSSTTLTEAEKATRQKTIEAKEKQLQRDGEEASTDYQSELGETLQTLAQKVAVVAQKYAQDNGFTILLDGTSTQQQQSPILWASESTNITRAVIDAYNTQSGIAAPAPTAPRPSSTTPRPSTAPKTPPASH